MKSGDKIFFQMPNDEDYPSDSPGPQYPCHEGTVVEVSPDDWVTVSVRGKWNDKWFSDKVFNIRRTWVKGET